MEAFGAEVGAQHDVSRMRWGSSGGGAGSDTAEDLIVTNRDLLETVVVTEHIRGTNLPLPITSWVVVFHQW